ncbi:MULTISPECIES: bifunctional diguanylate cyclase/phosphodiesterase [Ensifer]|uniref:bifunctional diguanylate cyclase/phosphodiesterase n=1 Tax=Ensifer TaxID=106591 RepID=UPI000715B7E2|nr:MULTISPECIES: EAL domain-containing protein [Ensifer]KQX02617.1 histidine kinase [Ensifer sp. Root423]MBD9543142.1 EAL domain-containing protein [Ensifer sp. ENS04]QHG71941.1 EAL domain-containing protein [Ensifer adhaerens]
MKRLSRVLTPSYLPAIIAAFVVLVAGILADNQNQVVDEARQRARVAEELNPIRSKLEANVNGNIQLVRGLIGTLVTEPAMDQQRFAALSRSVFTERSQLRSIAAAPNLIVSLVYPLEQNRRALGLDYRRNEAQRAAVMRVKDTGQMVLAGPVDLVQGGKGLIGRFPVSIDAGGGSNRFWGIVSAIIDVDRLYRDSGLSSDELGIDVAIAGQDGTGAQGPVFYGDANIFRGSPVEMTVLLPGGSWHIAAVPKGGWPTTAGNAWLIRGLIVIGGLMIILPMVLTGRLLSERQGNIRALRYSKVQLQELSHRLKIALDSSQIGIWELDIASKKLLWDERTKELYGQKTSLRQAYDDWKDALHPDDLDRAEREFAEALESGLAYNSDFRVRLPDGSTRHIRANGSFYIGADGHRKIVGVNWDVTADFETRETLFEAKRTAEAHSVELEAARHRMEFNALHDPLTGLPNRRFLDQVLADRDRHFAREAKLSIFHMDLDRFKQINDTLGHAAGDEILRHAAELLRGNADEKDFVARIGGDEFVLVRQDGGIEPDARLASRIIEAMSVPVRYKDQECRIGVSIGIAAQSQTSEELSHVLVNADIALYEAKRRGRNRHEIFTGELKTAVFKTKQTADEILRGLEHNEFIAHFQPQFCPRSLDIIGVEALARWDHPTKGLLGPHTFLKTAEDINVVAAIDQAILEQALFQIYRWEASGIRIPKVSVNLSYARLHDENLIERLEQLQIPAGRLSFELLESISFDESDMTVLSNIRRIKELGIAIEIDDFGTGYASIVSLLKLTPRRLKIDRQLVLPILKSPAEKRLVESIIDIGTSLGIEVIAEGVETLEHAAILKELGCHGLQGYAFARPMSANDLATFAFERRWLAA